MTKYSLWQFGDISAVGQEPAPPADRLLSSEEQEERVRSNEMWRDKVGGRVVRCRRCNKTASQHYGIARCYQDEDVLWLPPLKHTQEECVLPQPADRPDTPPLEEQVAALIAERDRLREMTNPARPDLQAALASLRAELADVRVKLDYEQRLNVEVVTELEAAEAERDTARKLICNETD